MAKYVRIGDLLDKNKKIKIGDRRFLKPAENIANHLFFVDVTQNLDYYVHQQPTVQIKMDGLNQDLPLRLGEYESLLLNKLLLPGEDSVICIVGDMGSGKTTTIKYILDLLRKRACESCILKKENPACRKLIAHVDFKISAPHSHENKDKDQSIEELLKMICDELRARVNEHIMISEELSDFWAHLFEAYSEGNDGYVNHVVRVLLAQVPREESRQEPNIYKRNITYESLAKDVEWHFRYLILLWRYVQNTRFQEQRSCILVVFDNVDTLHPNLQRELVDITLQSASKNGPTIIILLRPETRKRQGLSDRLVEVIQHEGREPFDVLYDRLNRFYDNPDDFLSKPIGLDAEQKKLVGNFLLSTEHLLGNDSDPAFFNFIRFTSGNSVRLALLLAQGMLMVRVSDMKNLGSPHYLVRACITLGQQQYSQTSRHPIQNLFRINNHEGDNYLVKLRLLRYISSRGESISLGELRNVFVSFGYEANIIKQAIQELMRNESKLISSDGYDNLRPVWGDEQETLFLTKIGQGYVNYLVFDVDFLQEIMLDTYVKISDWPTALDFDKLTQKLDLFYRFMRMLHLVDCNEVRGFIEQHPISRYEKNFGGRLLTLEIIQRIYGSVGRILSSVATKYPNNRNAYENVMMKFTSLIRIVEKNNKDLLGITIPPVDEIQVN